MAEDSTSGNEWRYINPQQQLKGFSHGHFGTSSHFPLLKERQQVLNYVPAFAVKGRVISATGKHKSARELGMDLTSSHSMLLT